MRKLLKILVVSGIICCLIGVGVITFGAVMGGGKRLVWTLDHADDLDEYIDRYVSRYVREAGPGSPVPNGAAADGAPMDDPAADGFGSDSTAAGDTAEGGAGSDGAAVEETVFGGSELLPGSGALYENVQSIELEVKETHVELRESADVENGCVFISNGAQDSRGCWIRQIGTELKVETDKQDKSAAEVQNIVLYVPEDYLFEQIEIENYGGSFQADCVYAEELSLEAEGGDLAVLGGDVRRLEAECRAGSIRCQAAVREEASAECSAGDVHLTMAGAMENYNYMLEYHMGKIVLNGQTPKEFSSAGEQHIDNHAGHEVKLECSAGTITVDYRKPVV